MEEAFFFENQGDQLFGMIHFPPRERHTRTSPIRAGIIFCHAFADEAFRTHREMVVYARRLAQEGFTILRFDYRGCGDSSGDFEDFSLETRISDIGKAIEILRAKGQVESIGLLGLRFGGGLAAAGAARNNCVNHLILWAPIFNGAKYFQFLQQSQMAHELGNFGKVISGRKAMAERLANGGTFDLMANIISQQVYQDLLSFDPWGTAQHCPENVFAVGIEGDSTKPGDMEILKKKYPAPEFVLLKEKLFWFDKIHQNPSSLYETTSQWLRDHFARGS